MFQLTAAINVPMPPQLVVPKKQILFFLQKFLSYSNRTYYFVREQPFIFNYQMQSRHIFNIC